MDALAGLLVKPPVVFDAPGIPDVLPAASGKNAQSGFSNCFGMHVPER